MPRQNVSTESASGYFYAFNRMAANPRRFSDPADQENMAHRQSRRSLAALHVVLFATLVWTSPANTATLSAASQAEIQALLSRLGSSGCGFRRNGTWHPADEAQVHLQRKLDYLVSKGAVASAEQFIERAATKSSVSGQIYLVRCGIHPPLPSSEWLAQQLQGMRATVRAPAPPLK